MTATSTVKKAIVTAPTPQTAATAVVGGLITVALQLVQSQFQWNQRTSLLATAIKEVGK